MDEIDDLNFAIDKIVFKGMDIDEVKILLTKRGVNNQQEQTILNIIETKYNGIRRIESSKQVRIFNYLIDTTFMLFFLIFIFSSSSNQIIYDYFFLIIISFPILYYLIPESLSGQTLGKFITGSVVVTESGEIPDFPKITLRTIGRLIPYDPLSLVISERVFHDRVVNTYVVNKRFLKLKYKNTIST